MPDAPDLSQRATQAAVPMEARLEGVRQNGDSGFRVVLDLHPADLPAAVLSANHGERFLVVLVPLNDDDSPRDPAARISAKRPGQNFDCMKPAAQVGMLCRDPDFRRFLSEWHRTEIVTPEMASEVVCRHCQVTRKRDITAGSEPHRLWVQLDTWYRRYMLRGDLP